jgi:hypothetical protein
MRLLMLSALHACFALAAVPVAAQTARPPVEPPCADTSSVPYRERVAIELIYVGDNRREMWQAIQLAGTSRTQCVVAKTSLPAADTSTYGVLRINALDNGGYEIATSLAGPRAPRQPCRRTRAAIVVVDAPILWGVLLAQTVPGFVECVIQARGPAAGSAR